MITKQLVAQKILAYLHHELPLSHLVNWAENALMDGQFHAADTELLTEVLSRLGLADVEHFGLLWEDCETFMRRLGYELRVEARLAA
jgi:hypothetical protein